MQRITTLVICLVLIAAAGCEQMKMTGKKYAPAEPMSLADMKKPSQPVQMKQLDPFIGTWEGTAEMVPLLGSAAATQPVQSFRGGVTTEWALDGMAVRSGGWHEMPDGQRSNSIEYITWDSRAQKFRTYYTSDWGDTGVGLMWADPGGQMFHWTAKGINARGQTSSMSGTSTVVDKNTMNWTFIENGPMGSMTMKGTSKRVN
jgi:hypothetical protein